METLPPLPTTYMAAPTDEGAPLTIRTFSQASNRPVVWTVKVIDSVAVNDSVDLKPGTVVLEYASLSSGSQCVDATAEAA